MKNFAYINGVTLFKNGQIVTSSGVKRSDLLVENGIITKMNTSLSAEAEVKIIDCTDRLIFPGIIDGHVHFREPGGEEKEDYESGGNAAVSGGVTTVCDMPNTNPPTIDQQSLDAKKILSKKSKARVECFIGANGRNNEILRTVKGMCGIKIYMGSSTGDLLLTKESGKDMEEVFQIAAERKILLAVHAEDEQCVLKATKKVGILQSPEDHSKMRPPECAALAVKVAIDYAREYGTHLHICHVSISDEVDIIRKAKREGLFVTAEVAPHHLFLDVSDYSSLGFLAKMNPPLRTKSDRVSLWEALEDGTIDCIATDHAPHKKEEKQQHPYPSGVPGIEDSFPLLLNEFLQQGLALPRLVSMMCKNPAQIFGFSDRGDLSLGTLADLVIVDPQKSWIRTNDSVAKCGWTLWSGRAMKGKVEQVFVGGKRVV